MNAPVRLDVPAATKGTGIPVGEPADGGNADVNGATPASPVKGHWVNVSRDPYREESYWVIQSSGTVSAPNSAPESPELPAGWDTEHDAPVPCALKLPSDWDAPSEAVSPAKPLNDPPAALPRDAALTAAVLEGPEINLRRYYRFLGVLPGECVELQVLKVPKKGREFKPNYFAHARDAKEFVELAAEGEGMGGDLCPAVYVLTNVINPAVATRAPAGKWHQQEKGAATVDADVLARRAVYIDIDPVRPSDTSATDAQMNEAHETGRAIVSRLAAILGNAEPIGLGHSGNGCAVLIALDYLPSTQELTNAIADILRALDSSYSSKTIKVDLSVTDPKRLTPAFGTMKRKGAAGVPEYPHRRSAFVCRSKVRRIGLDELSKLRDALRPANSASREGPRNKAKVHPQPKPEGPIGDAKDGPFARANAVPVGDVVSWLGLMESGALTCPGCRETTGVDIVGNGLKCFHDRCSAKGAPGTPGFRTPVDLVVEVHGVSPYDAVRRLADKFAFEGFQNDGTGLAKAKSALALALTAIGTAPEEKLAATVRLRSRLLGGYVGTGAIGRAEVESQLCQAAREAGLADPEAIVATALNDGLEDVAEGAPDPRRTLPVVLLDLDLHRVVVEVLEHLPKAENLYQRGGRLVRVIHREPDPRQRMLDDARAQDPDAPRPKAYVERPPGALAVYPYSAATLERVLSQIVQFERIKMTDKGPERVPCAPSQRLLTNLLEDGEWRGVRVLTGIAEHPILRADGTIAQKSGYDTGTGYVLSIPSDMPPISDDPSHSDAKGAGARLLELLSDFPWATTADVSAWLCLALTMVSRSCIDGPTPIFAAKANVRGSGKSRLMDVASIIVAGSAAARATQPADEAEAGKLLTSIAIEADPLVLFDNIAAPLGGGKLDAWTTGTRWKDRLLGVSATVDLPIITVLAVSGNNITYVGDTADRVLPIRLESPLENPRNRTGFKIPDLLGFVRRRRSSFLFDVLTIARSWFAAGRPVATSGQWGSFEGWCGVVPQMAVWAGLSDPMATREGIEEDEPCEVALKALIACWSTIETLCGGGGLTPRQLVDGTYDMGGDVRAGCEDVAAALEQLAPGRGREKVVVKTLGYIFRNAKNRVIGGKRLVISGKSHQGSMRWTVR